MPPPPTPGEPTPGSRRARAAETEAALKDAARRVFARHGYLNAKITDITAEAGRASGSFYNHFASKEQLLESLAADFAAEAGEQLTEHGRDHDLSDRAVLRDHVATGWHTYRAHLPEIVAMLQASMVDEGFAARAREFRAAEMQPLREHLEQMRAAGFQLPGDPAVVASALMSLLQQFFHVWIAGGGEGSRSRSGPDPLPDDEAIDTLTALILYGIAGQPAAPPGADRDP
jgi:AcrR family transcriptional regulator